MNETSLRPGKLVLYRPEDSQWRLPLRRIANIFEEDGQISLTGEAKRDEVLVVVCLIKKRGRPTWALLLSSSGVLGWTPRVVGLKVLE